RPAAGGTVRSGSATPAPVAVPRRRRARRGGKRRLSRGRTPRGSSHRVPPPGGRRRRQQQRGPEGRWRPRPAAGAAGRLRLELWQKDDETREEPERLHDADDDEGVRSDRVEEEPDESREIAEREPPPEGIPRGSVAAHREPQHRGDHPDEREEAEDPRLDERARVLRVHEVKARDPEAEDRPGRPRLERFLEAQPALGGRRVEGGAAKPDR